MSLIERDVMPEKLVSRLAPLELHEICPTAIRHVLDVDYCYNKTSTNYPLLRIQYRILPRYKPFLFEKKNRHAICYSGVYPMSYDKTEWSDTPTDNRGNGLVSLYTLFATLNETARKISGNLTHVARTYKHSTDFFRSLAATGIYQPGGILVGNRYEYSQKFELWNCTYPNAKFDVLSRFANPLVVEALAQKCPQ